MDLFSLRDFSGKITFLKHVLVLGLSKYMLQKFVYKLMIMFSFMIFIQNNFCASTKEIGLFVKSHICHKKP